MTQIFQILGSIFDWFSGISFLGINLLVWLIGIILLGFIIEFLKGKKS